MGLCGNFTNESSSDRAGHTVGKNIRRFKRKIDSITSGKQRQKVRAETWVKIAINPEDIALTPSDVLAKVTKESNYLGGRTNYCISSLFTQCLPFISFQSDLQTS